MQKNKRSIKEFGAFAGFINVFFGGRTINKQSGFTLIEVLVVVLIIGILTAVALPNYQVAVLKGRYTELMAVVDSLHTAEEVYYTTYGKYTYQLEELDVSLPGGTKLNTAGTSAHWRKNEVHIWLESPTAGGAVSSTHDNRLMYLKYFGSLQVRQCRAKETDAVANKVCTSLGGVRTANYNGYESYNFP